MKRLIWALCVGAAAVAGFFSLYDGAGRRATLLLIHGTIHTLDAQNSIAEAVAIRGVRIVGVGTTADLTARFRADSIVDLGGKTVMPGFIDAHCHIWGLGDLLESIALFGITSPDSILRLVREKAAQTAPGTYILGRGWDQNLWPVKEFPTAEMLDKVSAGHPVILVRSGGKLAVNIDVCFVHPHIVDFGQPERGGSAERGKQHPAPVGACQTRNGILDERPRVVHKNPGRVAVRIADDSPPFGVGGRSGYAGQAHRRGIYPDEMAVGPDEDHRVTG